MELCQGDRIATDIALLMVVPVVLCLVLVVLAAVVHVVLVIGDRAEVASIAATTLALAPARVEQWRMPRLSRQTGHSNFFSLLRHGLQK